LPATHPAWGQTSLEFDNGSADNTPRRYLHLIESASSVFKSRSCRLGVNLCVIGALLMPNIGMQPALADRCDVTASGDITCSGCGHCKVSAADDRCGCCSKQANVLATKSSSANVKRCCHRSQDEPSKAKSCCHRKRFPHPATEAEGHCLCGGAPQPAVPAIPSRSASEPAIKLLLLASLGAMPPERDPAIVISGQLPAAVFLLPRDAQRQLCVWRI
jgi:hypothetical protein